MIAISFNQTVRNYIYNRIFKSRGRLFLNLITGRFGLEKENFNDILALFLKYNPLGPISEYKAKEMMCAFKERAAKIDSTTTPKLDGYSVGKTSVEGLMTKILATPNFKRGWVVAKFSIPDTNKTSTINKIDIHLTGYVLKNDNSYIEIESYIPCGRASSDYDKAKNTNFINILEGVGYTERGGIAHEIFTDKDNRSENPDSFQNFINNYTSSLIYLYLGLDLKIYFTSVIFSNIDNLHDIAKDCTVVNTIENSLISFDEGGVCCPPG